LGVAVDYALGWGLESIWSRVAALAALLRARLEALPGVTVRDLGQVRCGIVTFTIDRLAAADLQARLAAQGINVSVSPASSARFDLDRRGLAELVRASIHYYNTEEEIDRFCRAVAAISGRNT
jgi:selenocysteine lyase/cysteine desulfurase